MHKHGISGADILHAWRNVLRVAEQDYGGESRIIAVGPARNGALVRLVVVAATSLPGKSTPTMPAVPSSTD